MKKFQEGENPLGSPRKPGARRLRTKERQERQPGEGPPQQPGAWIRSRQGFARALFREGAPGIRRVRNYPRVRIAIRAVHSQAVIAVGVKSDAVEHYPDQIRPNRPHAGLRLDDLFASLAA